MLRDANYEMPSDTFMDALSAFNAAQTKYDTALRQYRSREIEAIVYVVARAEWVEAQEIYAAAFAAELQTSD